MPWANRLRAPEQSEAVIDIGIVLVVGIELANARDLARAFGEMRLHQRVGQRLPADSPDSLSWASLEVTAKRGVTA